MGEEYVSSVLRLFGGEIKYKLSETSTRYRILFNPLSFSLNTLDAVQRISSAGIEIRPDGLLIECLKPNQRRKRRRVHHERFVGKFPKGYTAEGKAEEWLRYIMGIEDVCDFEVSMEDKTLVVKDLECITYSLLKHIQAEANLTSVEFTSGCMRMS